VFAVTRRFLLVALLALFLVATASSAAPLSRDAADAGAPPEPSACKPASNSPASIGPSAWNDDSLCGGRGNDTITSTKANPIWGYQGNDTIYASQSPAYANEINGGPGVDHAYVDSKDLANLTGVEYCKLNGKGKWRSCSSLVRAYRLSHPTSIRDFKYPYYQNYLQCRYSPSTARAEILFLLEPLMRAVDSTAQPDWQTVAFKATLYKWTGSGPARDTTTGWTAVTDYPWLWDRNVDEAALPSGFGPITGNYWRDFTNRQRTLAWFMFDGPGQFRVGLTLHWYPTATVPEKEFFTWAGPHYGDENLMVPGQKWCNFPN
jgi:hypothetical protein